MFRLSRKPAAVAKKWLANNVIKCNTCNKSIASYLSALMQAELQCD